MFLNIFDLYNYLIIIYLKGREIGKMILYFGCRKKEEDFIYEDELKEYVSNGTLTKVIKYIFKQ